MNTREFGKAGEECAAEYLRQLGFDIVGKNVYIKHFEIDIIAQKDDLFLFVEVKARRMRPDFKSRFGRPAASAVRYGKKKSLLDAAKLYINENKNTIMKNKHPRFDVIEIYADPSSAGFKPLKINHLKGAVNYM